MNRLKPRLTYANVVSTICLFLLLGGGAAYAASHLGKNTVGPKQLKKNAVTTAKIKNKAVTGAKIKPGTITGKQVNASTLGIVPSASLANSLSPLEAVHVVGAPGEPAFENGAHNLGSTGPFILNAVGFYKDHEGIVHMQGIAETGKTGSPFVFTLPPGFRPGSGKTAVFEQLTKASAFIFGSNVNIEGIDLSGKILGSTEETVVFDGITFRAES